MKIAMTVRGYIIVPRPSDMIYAPIDLAAAIAEKMSQRGHKVDMYAPIGSSVPGAKLIDCNLRPLVTNQEEFKDLLSDGARMAHYIPSLWDTYMVSRMFKEAASGSYDILHFHHPESALFAAQKHPEIPVVYTMHDPIYDYYKEMFELYHTPNQNFISISDNQRRDAPDLPYVRTVHNGIELDRYKFSSKPDDYLLYAGRIIPEKGVKEAIQVAKQSHHRLFIIGPVYPEAQGYFDQYVKPFLDDQILYLNYVAQEQMPKYYQKAKALLTPVQWEEPFGLTTIEAMASGTPVISLDRGAAKEIVINGKTGFIVDSISEMVKAVHKVNKLNRRDCRRHVQSNFSVDQMVDGYEAAFEEILRRRRKLSRGYVTRQIKKVPARLKTGAQRRRLQKIIESAKKNR